MAQGLHLPPALGLNTIIFKYVYWYMKQISGERLQDHWSSGWYMQLISGERLQDHWSSGVFSLFFFNYSIASETMYMEHVQKSMRGVLSGPEVIKLFSCSAQLRLKFILLINVIMPTIVGTLINIH